MRVRSKRVQQNQWLYVPQPRDNPRVRLFCFPYAGGSAEIFHQWADLFPQHIELCAVQLPGRSKRRQEKPFTRMLPLIQELGAELQPFLNIPFAFLGHSMGSGVLYELTQYLYTQGQTLPLHLFVAARKSPTSPAVQVNLHALTDQELISILRVAGGLPAEILQTPQLINMLLPTMKADFEVIETWEVNSQYPLLPLPIWAFAALNDPVASVDDMKNWSECTQQAFKLYIFPGDHYFAFARYGREAIVRLIVAALNPWLL